MPSSISPIMPSKANIRTATTEERKIAKKRRE